LVVPCYNEADRFPERAFTAYLESSADVSLIFVDDGSHDGTASVLERVVSMEPARAKLLRLPQNCGKGEAVRAGLIAALRGRPAYVGFWDADLATPLEAVAEFREILPVGERLIIYGRLLQERGKTAQTEGWLTATDGTRLVEATGTFFKLPQSSSA
jgi:glycosyltransferase involved in cell wall biosynthesis